VTLERSVMRMHVSSTRKFVPHSRLEHGDQPAFFDQCPNLRRGSIQGSHRRSDCQFEATPARRCLRLVENRQPESTLLMQVLSVWSRRDLCSGTSELCRSAKVATRVLVELVGAWGDRRAKMP
jgi:hypothetical protein